MKLRFALGMASTIVIVVFFFLCKALEEPLLARKNLNLMIRELSGLPYLVESSAQKCRSWFQLLLIFSATISRAKVVSIFFVNLRNLDCNNYEQHKNLSKYFYHRKTSRPWWRPCTLL